MEIIRKKHLEFIDITKGFGIILVILSHTYAPLMSWAGAFFIPVFFVASGYCTVHQVIIRQKFVKLMVPYILFTCILFVAYGTFQPVNFVGALYSRWCLYPISCTENLYLLRSGNGPLWFLTSMFVSFLIWGVIQRSKRPYLLLGACLLTGYALSFLPILLPWSIDTAFLLVLFFVVGEKVRIWLLLDKLNVYYILLLVCLYIVLFQFCGEVNFSVREYGTSLLIILPAAIIGSILLMKASCFLEHTLLGHILAKIGIHSLPIFCLHVPIWDFWKIILCRLLPDMPPLVNGIVITLLILLCMYPIAFLFDRYVLPQIVRLMD